MIEDDRCIQYMDDATGHAEAQQATLQAWLIVIWQCVETSLEQHDQDTMTNDGMLKRIVSLSHTRRCPSACQCSQQNAEQMIFHQAQLVPAGGCSLLHTAEVRKLLCYCRCKTA